MKTSQLVIFVFFVGNYYYMTHWDDMTNHMAVLLVENVAFANQGIYSASYVGDTPINGAWMRLIVRGLLVHVHTLKTKTPLCPGLLHSQGQI